LPGARAASDYDGWPVSAANVGWSYADVLALFQGGPRPHELGGDTYHGGDGAAAGFSRLEGQETRWAPRLDRRGRVEAGYPYNDDINGALREGFRPRPTSPSSTAGGMSTAADLSARRAGAGRT